MDWLAAGLIVLIVPFVLNSLSKAGDVPAEVRDGKTWLEYGRGFKILSSASMLGKGRNWAPLALSAGKLLIRNQDELKAFRLIRYLNIRIYTLFHSILIATHLIRTLNQEM